MGEFTKVIDLLPLTEEFLGARFVLDEEKDEQDEFIVDNDEGGSDLVVLFASRIAPAFPASEFDAIADRVSAFWAQHGYEPVRSVESVSGSVIVDAYAAQGDTLSLYISPHCTILAGEAAPVPAPPK